MRRFIVLAPVDPGFNNLSLLRECLRSRPRGRPLPSLSLSFFFLLLFLSFLPVLLFFTRQHHANTTFFRSTTRHSKVAPNCSLFSVFPGASLSRAHSTLISIRSANYSPAIITQPSGAESRRRRERFPRLPRVYCYYLKSASVFPSLSREHLARTLIRFFPFATATERETGGVFPHSGSRISFPNVIQSHLSALAPFLGRARGQRSGL